jgi:hypothetical protein
MPRDLSPQARISVAEHLWELARTGPGEIAELMHTNSVAVDVLRTGMNLFIQQAQAEARNLRAEIPERKSIEKIIIALDSEDGQITGIFTNDPGLIVRIIDADTQVQGRVWGPYDPEDTMVVEDVDATAIAHLRENTFG